MKYCSKHFVILVPVLILLGIAFSSARGGAQELHYEDGRVVQAKDLPWFKKNPKAIDYLKKAVMTQGWALAMAPPSCQPPPRILF